MQRISALTKRREDADAQAELERQRHEAAARERERQEAEERRKEAREQSRTQLLRHRRALVAGRNLEAVFEDADRRAKALDTERQATIEERLTKARAMLGGLDALERFLKWRSPEEIFETTKKW